MKNALWFKHYIDKPWSRSTETCEATLQGVIALKFWSTVKVHIICVHWSLLYRRCGLRFRKECCNWDFWKWSIQQHEVLLHGELLIDLHIFLSVHKSASKSLFSSFLTVEYVTYSIRPQLCRTFANDHMNPTSSWWGRVLELGPSAIVTMKVDWLGACHIDDQWPQNDSPTAASRHYLSHLLVVEPETIDCRFSSESMNIFQLQASLEQNPEQFNVYTSCSLLLWYC